jgi:hypothetical protein
MSLLPPPDTDTEDDLFLEFEEVTDEDVADAESTNENRNWMIGAILLGLWVWNVQSGGWQRNGQVLGTSNELSSLDELASEQGSLFQSLNQRYNDGIISLEQFEAAMLVELMRAHVTAGSLGAGGFDSLDQDALSRFMESEMEYLRGLFDRIRAGQSPALTNAHLRMYANHVRRNYYDQRRERYISDGSRRLERRILNPAEHCGDCLGFAAQGWQPIGTFPVPGDGSQCLSNCRCELEFK